MAAALERFPAWLMLIDMQMLWDQQRKLKLRMQMNFRRIHV